MLDPASRPISISLFLPPFFSPSCSVPFYLSLLKAADERGAGCVLSDPAQSSPSAPAPLTEPFGLKMFSVCGCLPLRPYLTRACSAQQRPRDDIIIRTLIGSLLLSLLYIYLFPSHTLLSLSLSLSLSLALAVPPSVRLPFTECQRQTGLNVPCVL